MCIEARSGEGVIGAGIPQSACSEERFQRKLKKPAGNGLHDELITAEKMETPTARVGVKNATLRLILNRFRRYGIAARKIISRNC
jgi:hypothetical protein